MSNEYFLDTFQGVGPLSEHLSESGPGWLVANGVLDGTGQVVAQPGELQPKNFYVSGRPDLRLPADTQRARWSVALDVDTYTSTGEYTDVGLYLGSDNDFRAYGIRFSDYDGIRRIEAVFGVEGPTVPLPIDTLGVGVNQLAVEVDVENLIFRAYTNGQTTELPIPVEYAVALGGSSAYVSAELYSPRGVSLYLPKLRTAAIVLGGGVEVFWTRKIKATETP